MLARVSQLVQRLIPWISGVRCRAVVTAMVAVLLIVAISQTASLLNGSDVEVGIGVVFVVAAFSAASYVVSKLWYSKEMK